MTAAGFMAATPAMTGSNTPWGMRYGREVRDVIVHTASNAPRSVQRHLGPSELGAACDRQVVGKLIAAGRTNNVADPWPSIVGTAVHAWLAAAFERENERYGMIRYLTELRVAPTPAHPGSTDLYDDWEQAVVDWKILGPTSLSKVRSPSGPSRRYQVQLLLYGAGCRAAGLPVKRVVLCALPRTAANLENMYVWDHPCVPDDEWLISEVLRVTDVRKEIAAEILAGRMRLSEVPITPDDDECFFCVSGDTQTVTRNGIKPISELAGGVHDLLVPTLGPKGALKAQGSFQPAEVREFGQQRLWTIKLRSRRGEKIVRATAEHRWILASGKGWALESADAYERTTAQLQPGDRLRPLRARPPARAEIMPVAVAQGFTFGDGTAGHGRRPATLAIYDNGKDEALLPFFPLAEPASYSSGVRFIYGLPRFWKNTPPLDESRSFLLSWLAGYFAADGDVTKAGQPTLSSASEAAIRFARDVAAICGIGYSPVRLKWRLGTGTVPTQLWSLNLRRRDLPDWFFVIPDHRARAAVANEPSARGTYWTVEEVTETDDVEMVYCATVPGAGAFGLADDLMTGNCPFYRPQSAYDNGPGCPGTIGNRELIRP